jgi:hypothetical protein
MSVWFKPNSTSEMDVVDSYYSNTTNKNLTIKINHPAYPGSLIAYNGSNNTFFNGSNVITVNQWHHVVMVWDASQSTAATKTKAYLNGSLLTNTSSTSFTSIINSQLSIFDYAISQNQVNYLYNSGTPINPMAIPGQQPVGYYPLGGSSTGDARTSPRISNFTLSLWYKQDAVSNRFLFDIKDGTNRMALQLVNASTNYFYFNSAFNAYSAVDTPINQWNNVVFVFDGSEANVDRIKLYVNGSRITASITGAIDATLGTFGASTLANLAAASTGGSLYALNGEITNTQIWTTSLGATDITTLYNNGVPLLTGTQPQAANLKAWYPMNVDNANWLGSDWQIAEATSAYPQSFDFDGSSEIINLGNDASLYPQTGDMMQAYIHKQVI